MEYEITTAKDNAQRRQMVADEWNMGPQKAGVKPTINKQYWQAMGDRWQVSDDQARRRLCANCEYADNTPEAMKAMESIPLDKFDMDGGGRVFCHRFDFICHNLRTCQAWEKKDFVEPDDMWEFG